MTLVSMYPNATNYYEINEVNSVLLRSHAHDEGTP